MIWNSKNLFNFHKVLFSLIYITNEWYFALWTFQWSQFNTLFVLTISFFEF